MELENQKFPWLDAMEFELNHRVKYYIRVWNIKLMPY